MIRAIMFLTHNKSGLFYYTVDESLVCLCLYIYNVGQKYNCTAREMRIHYLDSSCCASYNSSNNMNVNVIRTHAYMRTFRQVFSCHFKIINMTEAKGTLCTVSNTTHLC